MRIAIYHNLLSGGAKRTLLEQVRGLAGRHQIDAYSLTCSEHDFADIRPFVSAYEVFPFHASRELRSPFGRLNQVVRMADLRRLSRLSQEVAARIDAGRYDAVFVHPCRFEQSPSVIRYLRTPAVYYCHEPFRLLYESMPERPYDDKSVWRRRWLNRIDPLPAMCRSVQRQTDQQNLRTAGKVLVNSKFTAAAVRRIYQVSPEVSYHGVDADHFRPLGLQRQEFVLAVGSLTPLKGFDFLLRAMAEHPLNRRVPLMIASNFSNPAEQTYLLDLARELGVELRLRGNVTESELVTLYNEARAVVYAPVREPFGLVALEAMACGTPVVAVADGGVPESITDGVTGLLVDRDPRAFAMALHQVAASDGLAADLGARGRAQVLEKWTWATAIASLERHLAAPRNASGRSVTDSAAAVAL